MSTPNETGKPAGQRPATAVPDRGRPAGADPSGSLRVDASGSSGSRADEPTRVSDSSARAPAKSQPADAQPRIEGYELHEELHRGGQGIVYRATQLGTKRQVALKVLLEGPFASDTARMRFEREIELAASLHHPNIVTILDSGVSFGRYYFAMEFIDGSRLDQHFRQTRLPLRDTLGLLKKIADAVNFAHQRGVIHRDLKPSNILVDTEGRPHVLDFGLAKSAQETDPQQTTMKMLSTSGQVIGTLAYMSPEQAGGSLEIDVRSDVYSLGVIFYETLLGRTPYPIDGPLGEVLNRIARDEAIRPRAVCSASRFGKLIDDELETILLKSLEKDAARRYQTAGDLARDLQHYLDGEPIEAKRASGLYMLRKLLVRYRKQAIGGAALLVLLVVMLVVLTVQYQRERSLRQQGEILEARANEAALLAKDEARNAAAARSREQQARLHAEQNARDALESAEQLRHALIQQKVHRGDLARISGNLSAARDSYWGAYMDGADQAVALWALRQYYAESGDDGALQLYYRSFGPTALAPGGGRAAVCDSPAGISIRDTRSGETTAWHATPGPVLALSVDDAGLLVAAGEGWARLWPPNQRAPSVIISWAGRFAPRSAHVALHGAAILVAGESNLYRFSTADGRLTARAKLNGELTGEPRLSPDGDLLAVPTRSGLDGFRLLADGRVRRESLWQTDPPTPARAVCFVDAARIGVLADRVYLADFGSWSPLAWTPLGRLRREYDLLDVHATTNAILVASRSGETAIFRDRQLERRWKAASGLQAIRWAEPDEAVCTLDTNGTITRWVAPENNQERKVVHDAPASRWTVAEDGSALLLVDAEGELIAHAPGRVNSPKIVELPSLLGAIAGRRASSISVALNGAGSEALISYGGRLWRRVLARPRAVQLRPRGEIRAPITQIEMSWDARVTAFLAQSDSEGRQMLVFRLLGGNRRVSGAAAELWRTVNFPGSTIRQIGFLPHSYTLLVARSNGDLVLVDPPLEAGGPSLRELTAPWLVLEAPVQRFAFSRDGYRLALARDDGLIQIRSALDTSELGQINADGKVDSIAFNASGEVLLVRTADGTLDLYETERFERIMRWELGAGPGPALAAWLGDDDALVLVEDQQVLEIRFGEIDRRIAAGDAFAHQREVAEHLTNGEFQSAWQSAEQLYVRSEALGREARISLLESLLRRRQREIPQAWLDSVLKTADRDALIRLGHAAYEGDRFRLAAAWLQAAGGSQSAEIDGYTRWRMAECALLLGQTSAAADAIGEILAQNLLHPPGASRARLQLLAALRLAGRDAEARARLAEFNRPSRTIDATDRMRSMATVVIGNYLLGNQPESQLAQSFRAYMNVFKGQWLDYRDDIEFFAGEMARLRGDLSAAEARYQYCIDLARDDWPANWARHRLEQLARAAFDDKMPE